MTHSLSNASPKAHIKSAAIACFGVLVVVMVAAASTSSQSFGPGAMRLAVVKMGKPAAIASHGVHSIR